MLGIALQQIPVVLIEFSLMKFFILFTLAVLLAYPISAQQVTQRVKTDSGQWTEVTAKNEDSLIYPVRDFRKEVLNTSMDEKECNRILRKYRWLGPSLYFWDSPWKKSILGPQESYIGLVDSLISFDNPFQVIIGINLAMSINYEKVCPEIKKLLYKFKPNRYVRYWATFSLLLFNDNSDVKLIYDNTVELDDPSDSHFMKLLIRLDHVQLKEAAYARVADSSWQVKIFSSQIIGITGYDPVSDSILKSLVVNWPIEYKGYAIVALSYMGSHSLLEILKPLLNSETKYRLKQPILAALVSSADTLDQKFILNELGYPSRLSDESLNLLVGSKQAPMVSIWLEQVLSNRIPDDYMLPYSEHLVSPLLPRIVKQKATLKQIKQVKSKRLKEALIQILNMPDNWLGPR